MDERIDKVCTILKNELKIPLIAGIPHSSVYIPSEIRRGILIGDYELREELLILTDWYVNQLFSSVYESGGVSVVYNYSRLVVDPERFEDDCKEVMAAKGMGVIYALTSNGATLRQPLSDEDRNKMLDNFYRPYHRAMEDEAMNIIKTFGRCLILDCHSFPSKPLSFELDQDSERPDICIGTDEFHTPPGLAAFIEGFFRDRNFSIRFNRPYSRTYVPLKLLGDNRSMSIMIEINRKLYLDEKNGEKLNSFDKISHIIENLIQELSIRI